MEEFLILKVERDTWWKDIVLVDLYVYKELYVDVYEFEVKVVELERNLGVGFLTQ